MFAHWRCQEIWPPSKGPPLASDISTSDMTCQVPLDASAMGLLWVMLCLCPVNSLGAFALDIAPGHDDSDALLTRM